MRFEPKLFHEQDEPIRDPADKPVEALSGDLPDELAALGAQLGDDADSLARSYPARRFIEAELTGEPAVRGKRRWIRWTGAAAAALLAAGLWRVVDDRTSIDDSPPRAISAVPNAEAGANRPVAAVDGSIAAAKPAADETGLPASIFRSLTGAEQEAVLDLMQDGARPHGQLTI
jgi:hypothetical protein